MDYLYVSLCFGNIWRTDLFPNVVDALQSVRITITCSNFLIISLVIQVDNWQVSKYKFSLYKVICISV